MDSDDNVVYTVDKDYALNSTVDAYPDELVALQDRFISYPSLASFSATTSRSIDVPYSWVGPFELTTGDNDLHAYYFKTAITLMRLLSAQMALHLFRIAERSKPFQRVACGFSKATRSQALKYIHIIISHSVCLPRTSPLHLRSSSYAEV